MGLGWLFCLCFVALGLVSTPGDSGSPESNTWSVDNINQAELCL